jgi:hypothetical protein
VPSAAGSSFQGAQTILTGQSNQTVTPLNLELKLKGPTCRDQDSVAQAFSSVSRAWRRSSARLTSVSSGWLLIKATETGWLAASRSSWVTEKPLDGAASVSFSRASELLHVAQGAGLSTGLTIRLESACVPISCFTDGTAGRTDGISFHRSVMDVGRTAPA